MNTLVTPDSNLILILLIAALNAYTAWQTMQSKKTINDLEKNTNSIKDALVAATAKSSFREGTDAGAAQGAATAKALAATTAEVLAAATNRLQETPIKVDIVKVPPGGKIP